MEKEVNKNNIEEQEDNQNNGRITINVGKELKKKVEEYCDENDTNKSEYVKNCLLASISKDLNADSDINKDIDYSSEKGRIESYIESISNIFNTLEDSANAKCEEIRNNAKVDEDAAIKLSSNLSNALEEANKRNEELEDSNLLLSRTAEDQLEEIKTLHNQLETKDQLIASFSFNEQTVTDLKAEMSLLKEKNEQFKEDREKLIKAETTINQKNTEIEELKLKINQMAIEHDHLIKLQTENEMLKNSKVDLENRLNKTSDEKKA